MKNQWKNFNDADDQMSYALIPDKTLAKVKMTITRGGYVTEQWTDGYATKSKSSEAVYLACSFLVQEGEYANRLVWSNIGLYSEKSDKYAQIGRATIKAILNSAKQLNPQDKSEYAESQRVIKDFGDLDNLEFVAEISVDDKGTSPKNEIKVIITPDNPKYHEYMKPANGRYKIESGAKAVMPEVELRDDEVPF
jgi:hypothetical protein